MSEQVPMIKQGPDGKYRRVSSDEAFLDGVKWARENPEDVID